MGELLRFKLRLANCDVELESEDGTSVRLYTLVELDGVGRDAHVKRLSQIGQVVTDGKEVKVKSIDRFQSSLLASALFDKETGKPVPEETINRWPARVLEALCTRLEELSGLNE